MKSFDEVIRHLYCNVDIFESPESIVKSFRNTSFINYVEPVISQSSLSLNMELGTDKRVEMYRHRFSFKKGPIEDLKIDSGCIKLKVAKSEDIIKVIDIQWIIHINDNMEALLYFEKLKKMFMPLSNRHAVEHDPISDEYVAQFSSKREKGVNVSDVSIFLSYSEQVSAYRIQLFLQNELEN